MKAETIKALKARMKTDWGGPWYVNGKPYRSTDLLTEINRLSKALEVIANFERDNFNDETALDRCICIARAALEVDHE